MNGDAVILGAGQGGLTAAVTLRERGWVGAIHLVGEENRAPYQRPPLSKGYLSGVESEHDLLLRSLESLERDQIATHLGVAASALDTVRQRVVLSNGTELAYNALIFATGSAPRRLSLAGSELSGIHSVRTVQDSDTLRKDLERGGDTVFIGGGFLNLEIAAEASKHGRVTILEVAPQILGRVLSRESAEALADFHSGLGIEIRCGVEIAGITGDRGRVSAVELQDGTAIPASRVVVSIGAEPRDELAREAGIMTAGGIEVDMHLRSSDPRIFAIGDCARYPSPFAECEMRVESVQNATDQARYVAGLLTGGPESGYRAVPWFWSTQGERRLQIAGIAMPGDAARVVERGDGGKLVVERVRDGRVSAVETINAPGAHMRARRALAAFPDQAASSPPREHVQS